MPDTAGLKTIRLNLARTPGLPERQRPPRLSLHRAARRRPAISTPRAGRSIATVAASSASGAARRRTSATSSTVPAAPGAFTYDLAGDEGDEAGFKLVQPRLHPRRIRLDPRRRRQAPHLHRCHRRGCLRSARTGGRILADALVRNGVERIFCVPGESYLALLDALYDSPIAVTVCRQEGGAAMAAEAWGKLTGRPGIVMATRGPGRHQRLRRPPCRAPGFDADDPLRRPGRRATCAAARPSRRSTSARFFGEVAKWVDGDRQRRAHPRDRQPAPSTRRPPGGPVRSSSSLPEDMLRETAAVADAVEPWVQVETHPGLTQMAQLQKLLWAAERPFVILGGSRWSEAAVAALRRFAERFDLPVGCSFRRQMLFDHDHPNYAGDVGIGINPALASAHQGGRRAPPRRRPDERDAVLRLHADRHSRAAADAGPCPSRRRGARPRSTGRRSRSTPARPPSPRRSRACSRRNAHRLGAGDARRQRRLPRLVDAGRQSRPGPAGPRSSPGSASGCPTMRSSPTAPATIPAGCIASSASAATARSSRRPPASMGYGLPAAIAAKLRHPGAHRRRLRRRRLLPDDRQEFAHRRPVRRGGDRGARQQRHPRHHPHAPGARLSRPRHRHRPRQSGFRRASPAPMAATARRSRRTEDFAPAFERAVASGKPAIIDVKFDPEAISPSATLSAIRGKGRP